MTKRRDRWVETPGGVAADLNRYDDIYNQERGLMLVVTIKHVLAEDDPALTDALGEFLRNLEESGIVRDFSFEEVDLNG